MTYTKILPQESGWYWWKPDENTDKIFKKKLPAGIYYFESLRPFNLEPEMYLALPRDRNRYPIKMMAGSWAGPIEEPKEQ